MNNNLIEFKKGMKHGLPISIGYLAVSFTLGIAAKRAGLTGLQAMFTSMAVNASAGEFAGFTLIGDNSGYMEMAIMIFVANARYILMSCALSQKLAPETPLRHRLIIGYDVTDEIFGISVSVPGRLNPFYTYGAILVSVPGWAIGTYLGVLLGNILPSNIVSALGVGLYGMFLAVIIPPARKNKILAGLIAASMVASYFFSKISFFDGLSSGIKIIILTVLIAGAAALIFPVKEDPDEE